MQAMCPVDGKKHPAVPCNDIMNCVFHCCTTSGLCPSSSCVSSFNAPNDARANCENKCLEKVRCIPIVATCVPHDNQQHCFGRVECINGDCDGRTEGDFCLYDGVSKNFKICDGSSTPPPEEPYCEMEVHFCTDCYFDFEETLCALRELACPGIVLSDCGSSPGTFCINIIADISHTPVVWGKVDIETAKVVEFLKANAHVYPDSVVSEVVDCNVGCDV